MSRNFRSIIFDLDGTLLDTLKDLADSMNDALAQLGYATHPREAYRYFVGDGVRVMAQRALPDEAPSAPDIEALVHRMSEQYAHRWAEKTTPYDGVENMLNQLVSKGIEMAVLSNKPHDFTVSMVKHFFPHWTFKAVRGVRPGWAPKPDITSALDIAGSWPWPPSEVLYMGDTATDMETALGAGFYPLGACWGFRPREELQEAGAARLLNHPKEVLDLLTPRPEN